MLYQFNQAVDFYTRLLSKYSPQGVLSYTEDQARAALTAQLFYR